MQEGGEGHSHRPLGADLDRGESSLKPMDTSPVTDDTRRGRRRDQKKRGLKKASDALKQEDAIGTLWEDGKGTRDIAFSKDEIT